MKQIIQISPYAFDHPGGVEQYARVLQEIFPGEMTTFAGGTDFPILEPVPHCPLPTFWRRGFWKAFQWITRENTSYIISHIRFAPTSWLAYILASIRGIPYIHIEHGTGFLVHKNPFVAFIAKMVDLTIGKYIIRHASQVITVSEAGKKWVSETFGRTRNISVIYRGFDFPKVDRIKNTIPKIGFVGRLTGLKNLSGLIDALGKMKETKWELEIVGDGEERAHLETQVLNLGLDGRVHFLGAKPHDWIINEFYPRVDIFVNPSLQEGLPTTVIEALGMGCYTLASDVGGTSEITGVHLFPADNTNALIKVLQEGLGNTRDGIHVTSQFSLEQMKKEYTKLFRK